MPRQTLQPEGLATPKPPYSPVVISGETVYTAGQIANDPNGNLVQGGIAEQTRRALQNVRACVEAAGCSMADVVKVNAPYPARTSVQAGLPAGVLLEIEAVARRPS
jgi:2-iminobutanoate/2-iminopropanoate deaminase